MLNSIVLNFKKGLKDGIPIALGYLSVSFTFGILVLSYGLPIWTPIVTSLTNFTGTGQFIGMEMLKNGALLYEIGFTMIIINIRYVLMSISISQRLDNKTGFFKRLLISFGVTDEVYAVAMNNNAELNFKYLMGLMLGSFCGWIGGTTIGSLVGYFLQSVASAPIPSTIIASMGITIYGMFIAIIVPPAKDDKPVLITVLIAIIISSLLSLIPWLNKNNFYIIIIAGILSTLVATFMFPIHEEVDTLGDVECEEDVLNQSRLKEDIKDGNINISDSVDINIDTTSTKEDNDDLT